MALIHVSQISFESEVGEVKWRHFYDKIVSKYRNRYGSHIWPVDRSGQNEACSANLCLYADFVTMATVVNSCNDVT